MINVNGIIINEKLIKIATPYFVPPKEGIASGYGTPYTKIVFTNNSEVICEGLDCYRLWDELNKLNGQGVK